MNGTAKSLTKPYLRRVSGSGAAIEGLVLERVIEGGNAGDLHPPDGPSKHVLVIPTSSARLDWKADGRGRAAWFQPGDILINPRGNFVAPRWSREVEFFLLGIDPEFLAGCPDEWAVPPAGIDPRFHFRDELLFHLVRALASEFEGPAPADRLYTDALAGALMAHLLKGVLRRSAVSPKGGLSARQLAQVRDFIEAHLAGEIRLPALARQANLSPSHFLALFRRSTGLSPHQYLMRRRVERARSLLRQRNLSLVEIAQCCGFADQSHLTRMVRRYTGATPRQLREG
ncbi:MAG TPA: AraC family transcriptional regulator [Chthoniobacterales bacterium]